MELKIEWIALLIGIIVGIVCIGGLALGFKIIIDTQQSEALRSNQRFNRYAFASAILIGQLLIAMSILFKTPWVRTSPLGVGIGIMASILGFAVLMNFLSNSK